jgi:hypothetical protein
MTIGSVRPLLALVVLAVVMGGLVPAPFAATPVDAVPLTPNAAASLPTTGPDVTNNAHRRSTATKTPTPTKVPTPTATPPSQVGARVNINANLYPFVDATLLRPGDIMKAQAIRSNPAVPVADSVFVTNCLDRLNAITAAQAQQSGLAGQCDFSAWEDAQTYVHDARLPAWVRWFEFDFEPNMTPANEFASPVTAVSTFSGIVHAAGMKVIWTPTRNVLLTAIGDGDLALILPMVDAVEEQYQNAYTTESQFVSDVTADAAYVHAHGAALYDMQLWTPTQDCATMVLAFRDVAAIVDIEQIGTHSDGTTVACVIADIR